MYVILMRHGIAEDGTPDEARELTDRGRRRVALMAQLLGRFNFRPDVILTSHRVRAIQTAQIVQDELDLDAAVEKTGGVDIMVPFEDFCDAVNERMKHEKRKATLLVVGHQPMTGMMARMMVHGEEGHMDVRKAGCVGIRFGGTTIGAGGGQLRFYLTPSLAQRF